MLLLAAVLTMPTSSGRGVAHGHVAAAGLADACDGQRRGRVRKWMPPAEASVAFKLPTVLAPFSVVPDCEKAFNEIALTSPAPVSWMLVPCRVTACKLLR